MSLTPGTQMDPYERVYLSANTPTPVGLTIMSGGQPTDADGDVVVSITAEATGELLVNAVTAQHPQTGVYLVPLTSAQTATPGNYQVSWSYSVQGTPEAYLTFLEIGQPSPLYDALSADMKQIVETTMIRFADLYDSPSGGPNLQTYFQTHYGRNRLAGLLRIAIGTLNTVSQPYQTYTVDGRGGAAFPVVRWGALLERALYVETLKHLVRSYVEQPMMQTGEGITRQDRRDYMDRWNQVLQAEEATLNAQLDVFKISQMGLGTATVLVAGGVFGKYFNTRTVGYAAARPAMAYRFY